MQTDAHEMHTIPLYAIRGIYIWIFTIQLDHTVKNWIFRRRYRCRCCYCCCLLSCSVWASRVTHNCKREMRLHKVNIYARFFFSFALTLFSLQVIVWNIIIIFTKVVEQKCNKNNSIEAGSFITTIWRVIFSPFCPLKKNMLI